MTTLTRTPSVAQRAGSVTTALACLLAQLALPTRSHAATGMSTASAGSAPPPAISAIQSFQPDLFTGRATTSIPLAVPPGRKGLQPSLGLSYSSSGRNGWVGTGWSLDLGSIERNTKAGVPLYGSTDTYTLMFQGIASDLVKIPDGTYRLKDEGAFLKITSLGAAGWEVRDKSGTRYLFGQTVASQVIDTNGRAFRWALDKVIDVNGNTMLVTYTKDQLQLYPAQIRYTGHEPTTLAPANQIDFTLEDRPDWERHYRGNFRVVTAKRLKRIEMTATVGGALTLARRYDLSYNLSSRTSRSLLAGVTQVGADGVTSLPAIQFTYQDSQAVAYGADGQPLGTATTLLSGDVDGDAVTDMLSFAASGGQWTVRRGRTDGSFWPPETWLSNFGDSNSATLLGDWNGDGTTDLAIFTSGTWRFATSTAAGFTTTASQLSSPLNVTPLIGDFNGDGLTDIGTFDSPNGEWLIALSTGTGFGSWTPWINWGHRSSALIGDFNGDGLTDIGGTDGLNVSVCFSTGSSFSPTGIDWIRGFTHRTTADVNGDGLTDLVDYTPSTGQIRVALSTGFGFSAPTTLPLMLSPLGYSDDVLQFGDFNGDGLPDAAVFSAAAGFARLGRSQGNAVDVLASIANGLGGSTTIEYFPSTQCNNLCPVQNVPKLPFVLALAKRVTLNNGMGHQVTTTYDYHQGRYDGAAREFRGFGKVTVRDPDNHSTITEFAQDEIMRGRPLRTEFRDAAGTLWTKTEQTWSSLEPQPGVHFVKLDQADSFVCDGDATCRQTRSRLTYDEYGNVTRADEDGEPTVTGDERSSTTAYVSNTSAWIIGKPRLSQTLAADGSTVVAQRRFYYDGATDSTVSPVKGNLTKEEEWVNLPIVDWPATTLTYDPYGNVATVTDALGRTTTNTYDAGGTYLTQIANALGHTRQLSYDARFGAVTASTDQNNVTTTTQYDALGRVTKVIGPDDTEALPTVRYEYTLSPTAPSRTAVYTRLVSGQSTELAGYTFIDGLGRTIQARSPAEDSTKQIVTGAVELNNRGLVNKQYLPYLETSSTSYVAPGTVTPIASLKSAGYAYDAAGRTLSVTDPDGSVTSTAYDDWSVTATDARGNSTRRSSDSFGRLAKVEELNGAETYTTRYEYDTLGNLKQVTDHAGNITQINYDSLGRKLGMTDPDMGVWSYAYDAVDNLTSQTDARGVIIGFTYDPLNRLTTKSYTIPGGSGIASPGNVAYTYDDAAKPFSKGKLTSIADGSGASHFEYDKLGRLTKESKTIDGATYTIQRAYDLLGRLTTLTYPDNDIVRYTYNSQGGIETVTHQASGSSQVTTIAGNVDYNAAGQITKLALGNGITTDYTYHQQTLRLQRLISQGSGGALQDFEYGFDAVGNVTQITDRVHTATQSFQYDPLNRLTQASGAYGTMAYAYDPIGNMTSKEGAAMTYGAGPAGPHAVTSTTTGATLTYDANGNATTKTEGTRTQAFTFDADNRLAETHVGPTDTITLTFKPGWNFFSLPLVPSNLSIASLFPTFSSDFESVAKWNGATGTFQHYVGVTGFDDFTTLQYGVGYQVYCKNPNGKTVTITGTYPSSFSASLSAGWHLLPAISLERTTLQTIFGGLTTSNLQSYNPTTGTLQPATDVQAGQSYYVQLTTASTWAPPLPSASTSFVYDGDGGRVKKISSGGTTVYLGNTFEKAPTGITTKHIFAGSQRLASKSSDGQFLYYLTDHLGSSNVIVNHAGQMVELTEHLPFGAISRDEGTANVAHKFTAQRQGELRNLIVFPGRVYDTQLGRFLQADPFIQDPTDPQSLNRYSYVRNNPVNFTDPSGYWRFKINILGFGFEIGSERVSVSIAGLTAGYDFKHGEVFVGIEVGLQVGEIGGTVRAGAYYNVRTEQAGLYAGASVVATELTGRLYYDFQANQVGASVTLSSPTANFFANTDGQRSAGLFGQSIPVKGTKSSQAVAQDLGLSPRAAEFEAALVQVYSRPAFFTAQHMLFVYDNGTRLWELTRASNGRIHFNKPDTKTRVDKYLDDWKGQLKGPLTFTVDPTKFERALADQETREGQRYRFYNRNSNYAVKWVINQSIMYGIGAAPNSGLGSVPDGIGNPTR